MPGPIQARHSNTNPSGATTQPRLTRIHLPASEPPPAPPRGRRYYAWIAAGVAVALVVAAAALVDRSRVPDRPGATNGPAFARTAVVRAGELVQSVRLTGRTVARNSVLLRAPYLRGRGSRGGSTYYALVLQTLVPSGTHVKKGDLVASFDMIAMRNRLDDLQAESVDAELRVKTLAADLAVKREEYRRRVRLAKSAMDKAALDLRTAPVRSAIQVSLFKLAFEEAKARHQALLAQAPYQDASARAEMRTAQLALKEAKVEEARAAANVAKMQVRAPVDGMAVVQEIFRGGQMNRIRPGDQLRSRQGYLEIVDARSLIIEAKVNQVDVERLRMGAQARVRFDAFPGLDVPAHVYAIAPMANTSTARAGYVSELPVFLKLDRNGDPRLIPDLTVSVAVTANRAASAAIVPRESVFRDNGGEAFAYVRGSDGWQKRFIEVGMANHVAVEVRSGLREGEIVAASAPDA